MKKNDKITASRMGVPSAAIYTLGCKVNQYESEAIAEALKTRGFQIVPFDTVADVYIINTCTVTAESDRKACQIIRRAVAKGQGNACVLVTGCMAQTQAQRIAGIDGVSYICGSRNKMSCVDRAVEYVLQHVASETPEIAVFDVNSMQMERMAISHSGAERTRAYIKIEDGCENRCAYCAIPNARGNVVSKSKDDVIREVGALLDNGYREIVLTGIEIASYGKDLSAPLSKDPYRLIDLLEEIDRAFLDCNFRIRLGSLEPTYMKPDVVRRMAALKSLAHHFHLSLQNGADHVLHLMKRKYNMQMVRRILSDIRACMSDVMFTTDIMTGFPQETEEDFAQTEAFLREAQLLHVHVFPYSRRANTVADLMNGQLKNEIKNQRANILIALQSEITAQIYRSMAGIGTVTLLCESYHDGYIVGHTSNFLEVRVSASQPMQNEFLRVRIVGNTDTYLIGEPM
ncbi:MAG: tRNA (N(6)-L-threonylcarbamoyladenosine(37)-C(2))-methylthiotransferase MtaB [Clostridia bacterium]|nr:tRNA (N(6)-L-threonylcarbamoyladenosine(37)-C(2))-methylthiotransferase MtaB [Clostridia bacterium]